MKKEKYPDGYFSFGGPNRDRTDDLTDANRTLSQLSYRPKRRLHYRTYSMVCKELFCERAVRKQKRFRAGEAVHQI